MKPIMNCVVFLLGVLVVGAVAEESSYSSVGGGYNSIYAEYDQSENEFYHPQRQDEAEAETEVEEEAEAAPEKAPYGRTDEYSIALIIALASILMQLVDSTIFNPMVTPITTLVSLIVSTPVGALLTVVMAPFVAPLTQLVALINIAIANKGRNINGDPKPISANEYFDLISDKVLSVIESENCWDRLACEVDKISPDLFSLAKSIDVDESQNLIIPETSYSKLGKEKCSNHSCRALYDPE